MKDYLTVKEVADYLSLSPFQVTKLIDEGGLPAVNVGTGFYRRRLRVSKVDLEAWLIDSKNYA